MIPRPYQTRAIDAARQAFQDGSKAVLVVAPTGSGKTCMGATVVAGHLARAPENRVVWLAHRTELLDQAAGAIHAAGLEVSLRNSNPSARVHVESVQTILARGHAPEASLLIADEAHHYVDSGRWGDIVALYKLVLGLTATPERGDGKPLSFFQSLVVAAQIRELIELGYLVPLHVKFPVPAVGKGDISKRPVDAYLAECKGQRAIVFAGHLKAAESYLAGFREQGIRCALVSGKTPAGTRADVLAMHKRGELQVLVNCGVLTEGYDDPAVSCIIIARRCDSQGLWLQMTGRGLRPSAGKARCTLLDLMGMVHTLGRPDSDRIFSLEGEPISLSHRATYTVARLCASCKTVIDDSGVCFECGMTNGLVIPKATGVELFSWEDFYKDVRDNLKPRRDAISLAGMLRKYRKPDGKPNLAQATNRYFAIFKRYPDATCVAQARELNEKSDIEFARAVEERDRAQAELMEAARQHRRAAGIEEAAQ
jgi:DNA repair protein RadD